MSAFAAGAPGSTPSSSAGGGVSSGAGAPSVSTGGAVATSGTGSGEPPGDTTSPNRVCYAAPELGEILANTSGDYVGYTPSTADFNGDGELDLLVPIHEGDGYGNRVLLGNGDGTFGDPIPGPVLDGYAFVVPADVNGDGTLDLVAANRASNEMVVLIGNGDGTFAPVEDHATPVPGYETGEVTAEFVVADFNDDGRADLGLATSDFVVLLGQGDGTFVWKTREKAYPDPTFIATGDLDEDGYPDLVGGNGQVTVLIGNRDGTFEVRGNYLLGDAQDAALLDFDNDGHLDLAVGGACGRSATAGSLLLGDGKGGFSKVIREVGWVGCTLPQFLDVNADGNLDFFQFSNVGLGNGDGTFVTQPFFQEGGHVYDWNGDGVLDIANVVDGSVRVLLGKNSGADCSSSSN